MERWRGWSKILWRTLSVVVVPRCRSAVRGGEGLTPLLPVASGGPCEGRGRPDIKQQLTRSFADRDAWKARQDGVDMDMEVEVEGRHGGCFWRCRKFE